MWYPDCKLAAYADLVALRVALFLIGENRSACRKQLGFEMGAAMIAVCAVAIC